MDISRKRKLDDTSGDVEQETSKRKVMTEESSFSEENVSANVNGGQSKDCTTEELAHVKQENAAGDNAAKHSTAIETVIPYDRLILLNVEATCDENPTNPAAIQVSKDNAEVIELSYIVVDGSTMQILHKEHIFVNPKRTQLTNFCMMITGITRKQLDAAGSLMDAIQVLDQYIQEEIVGKGMSFCFVTHGGWVLRMQLPREARDKDLTLPDYITFCRMFDLKQEIQRWQLHHPEVSIHSTSLSELCALFNLEDVIIEESVGLSALATMVNVMRYLVSFRYHDVFVNPIDIGADFQQFKKEESKAIHLAGLPYELTQGELEAWFSSNGLRPVTMWTIQPQEYSKPSISGFAVFMTHNDAVRALTLNGRCLGDRPVEVCPSSERTVEAAGNMLIPFPVQAKSRRLRPGDWNCANCGFHNFASRRNCFKCNAENPTPSTTNGYGFSSNDWVCPNTPCGFRNYASRTQCLKCNTPRPSTYSATPLPCTLSNSTSPGSHSYARPHHHATFRPGDWYCPNPVCNFQNFASRAACFRCQTPNPAPSQSNGYGQAYGYSTDYQTYDYQNYQSTYPGPFGTGNTQFRPGDWICQTCNSHNFASRLHCMKCSEPKPQVSTLSYTGSSQTGKGDWVCGNESCRFFNFAKRTQCGKCGMASDTSTTGAEY